ncbi:DNA helicase UvrD [Candidatus Woesearchaeota archaeon]|nr:DNA helicase UvrD [Candidatus Woesearchaeota archaeon]
MIIADLHVHSKYARATSKSLDLENLEKYARIKGLHLLGTGDFTHPAWIRELKSKLTEQDGICSTASGFPFLLQTEISLIYSDGGKGRRIHNIVLAPGFAVVEQITEYLLKHGRVDYDGRPIFNIPCPEFTAELKKISADIEIIPAHVWTPWFSLYGSMSGFNSIKECFKDQARHIKAIETGLSSDPGMNWRLSELDNIAIVSFSDLHSHWPWRIGREATVFDVEKVTYKNIIAALHEKKIQKTIEFWPEEGKYHYDGHRNCNVCLHPADAVKNRNRCPACGSQLTIGVLHRVEELADRPEGFKPAHAIPFQNLIPLSELIAGISKQPVGSQKVWKVYNDLIAAFGNEFSVLLDAEQQDLVKAAGEKVADIIIRNRSQKIPFKPGYDGVYGIPLLSEEDVQDEEIVKPKQVQKGLGDY